MVLMFEKKLAVMGVSIFSVVRCSKHGFAVMQSSSASGSLVAERCLKISCFQMTLLLISKVSFLILVPQRERQVKFTPLHHLQMDNITVFNVLITVSYFFVLFRLILICLGLC